MPTFRHDGIDLCYDERGATDTPTLVLLHGLGTDGRMWHPVARGLGAYHVILPDLRGHGGSEAPEEPEACSIAAMAADVLALTGSLGLDLFALGGWDLGGRVAIEVAETAPQRVAALALADTCAGPPPALRITGAELETARRYGTRWLGKLEAMETADAFAREAVRWSWGRISTDGLLGAAAAWQASPPASEALTPPLLMMMSSGSPMAPEMERIARAGGPERRIFIRDAGGAAPLHRPEATARALREFLRDVEGGRPISGEWEI